MDRQFSTGAAARILKITEPRLNDLVRRGKIDPTPLVSAGRRIWEPTQILQAAEHLGLLTEDLEQQLREEVPSGE